MLRAEFSLPSITDEEAALERRAPIRLKFEIPYFTVSGIQVCSSVTLALFINLDFLNFLASLMLCLLIVMSFLVG